MPDDLNIDDVAAEILGATPKAAEAVSTIDFAARAAEAEAELIAADPGDKPGKDSGDSNEEVETAAAELGPLQKLIQSKYKGDEQAFVDGLHEQWNSSSALAKEIQELKAKLESKAEAEKALPNPDVELIAEEIASLEEEVVSNRSSQGDLVARGSKLKEDIAELKGERKRADELDQEKIDAKIAAKTEKLDALSKEWLDLEKANKKLTLEKSRTTRKLEKLREDSKPSKEETKSNNNSNSNPSPEEAKQVVQVFGQAIKESMEENKLLKEDEEHFYNVVRAEITHYMRTLSPDSQEAINGVDIPAFVKARMAVHAKKAAKANFADLSKEKLNVSGDKAKTVIPKPASNGVVKTSEKVWDAKFARQRAAKIMGS